MANNVSFRTQPVSLIADVIDVAAITFGMGCVALLACGVLALLG